MSGSSGVDHRIAELAERYRLDAGVVAPLRTLLDAIQRDPLAPTTVRDPALAVDEHLADSLVALELDEVSRAREIADIGAGAGFPGLPLAIAHPQAAVHLVESNRRKCEFLVRTAAATTVNNVTVVNARAEAWSDGLDRFDLITARALAPPAVVAEYAAPLLVIGGALVIWRGRGDPAAERDAEAAASRLGLAVSSLVQVHPFAAAEHRYLYVMSKVTPTPQEFPRRPGMARKRPLRA